MKQIYDFNSISGIVLHAEKSVNPYKNIFSCMRKILPGILLFLLMLHLGGLKSYAQYTVPTSGSNSYTTCSGTLYDNGGSGSNYSNSCNGYTIIYPGTAGAKVQLSGTATTESSFDYLYIYNGAGTGGTLLYSGSGSSQTISTLTSTDASGALTVRFTSDGSVPYAGFALSISCYVSDPLLVPSSGSNSYTTCSGTLYDNGGSGSNYSNSCNGYTIIYPGTAGAKVQLNGTGTTESCCDYLYIYNGVGTGGTLLYQGGGNTSGSISVSNITSTDASGALTVRFTSDGSVSNAGFALSISCYDPNTLLVPSSGSNSYTTCTGTLYDAGGPSGSYDNYWDGYTVLYPGTAGAKVRLNGTGTTESCCDYLYIYNGVGTGGTLLYQGGGNTSGSISVSNITSTDASGALTVKFTSDVSGTYSGFALSVSCFAPLSCATLNYPADNATDIALYPTFQWSAVSGATGYRLYLSTTSTRPASPIATTASTSYYYSSGLDYGTTYYWWVIPYDNLSSASGCEPNIFLSYCPNPVPTPTITASANTVFCGDEVTLTASGSVGNYKWYADAGGTELLYEGAAYTFQPEPGAIVYCQSSCAATPT
ncbi:MAG TPA: hypothetical protein PK740_03320, partial [Bacteroidales bacterium]|nr:hypothetical protein [Bacteroidales bacterium]